MEKGHSERRGPTKHHTPPRLVTPPPYPQTILLTDEIGTPNVNFAGSMGNGGKHNKEYTPARRASETNFDNTATTLTNTVTS